jgi:hypothetical protein
MSLKRWVSLRVVFGHTEAEAIDSVCSEDFDEGHEKTLTKDTSYVISCYHYHVSL